MKTRARSASLSSPLIWILSCCLLPAVGFSASVNDERDDALFNQAIENTGAQYDLAVSKLVDRGEAIVPFLESKSSSQDWQESSLAEAILLKIQKPEFVTKVGTYMGNITFINGKLAARSNHGKPMHKEIEKNYFFFTLETLPLFVDDLRSATELQRGLAYHRLLVANSHFNMPKLAPALLHFYEKQHTSDYQAEVVKALAKFGPAVVPLLEQQLVANPIIPDPPKIEQAKPFVHDPNDPFQSPLTQQDIIEEAKQKHEREIFLAWSRQDEITSLAALALAEIGTVKSGELMLKHLEESKLSMDSQKHICHAISRLKPEGTAEVLFEVLANQFQSRRSLPYDGYFDIRNSFIEMKELATKELKKQISIDAQTQEALTTKAIATGILFEIENPKPANIFYEQMLQSYFSYEKRCGRTWLEDHEDDDYDSPQKSKRLETKRLLGGRKLFGPPFQIETSPPTELLLELAAASQDTNYLRALGQQIRPNQLAKDWLLASALKPDTGWPSDLFVIPLAKAGGASAVDGLCKLVTGTNDPFLYLQAAIEIEDPSAAKVLDPMLQPEFENKWARRGSWKKIKQLISNVKSVLANSPDIRGDLLSHEDLKVRLVAAVTLVQKKETKSIPVLFDAILENAGKQEKRGRGQRGLGSGDREAEDGFEQREAERDEEANLYERNRFFNFLRHKGALNAIVAIGENAISEIESSAKLSSDKNAALLAKLLTTRIKEPEQYAKFRTAIDAPGPNWHGGPSEEDLERQAVDLANAITAKNAWVLEAEVA